MKKSDYPTGVCSIDSSATAYFIFDRGVSSFITKENGWKLIYERHFRIKIDDKKSIKEGNITLWLHDKGIEGKETVEDLVGYTYNLENKKWITTRANLPIENKYPWQKSLTPKYSGIITDTNDPEWKRVDIKLPKVKKGSVIELYYKIESDLFFEMEGWKFTKHIPVLNSQYSTIIPEYFEYRPIIINDSQMKITTEGNIRADYSFLDRITKFEAKNLLSNTNSSYIRNPDEFLPQVKYEFMGYKYNNKNQSFEKTWSKIKQELLSDTAFGAQLRECNCFDVKAKEIFTKDAPQIDKINEAFKYVKSTILWNNGRGIKAEIPIDSAYKYHSGNAAEINLAFICFLKKMKIDATPVLSSTADHGIIYESIPSVKWFDYTVAKVQIDDKIWLIDAAEPNAAINLLPPDLINDKGLIVDTALKDENTWIDITANGIAQSQTNYELTIDPAKGIKGKYTSRDLQYSAYLKAKLLSDSAEYSQYFDNLNYTHPTISLYNTKVNHRKEQNELLIEGDIIMTRQLDIKDNKIIWVPLQYEKYPKNPFHEKNRIVPVDFIYPIIQNVTMEINIPAGYTIEKLPKSGRYSCADNSMKYTYIIEQSDSTISLSSMLSIKRNFYLPEEYKGLQEFFTHLVNKQNEAIVFRKK